MRGQTNGWPNLLYFNRVYCTITVHNGAKECVNAIKILVPKGIMRALNFERFSIPQVSNRDLKMI